MISRIPPPCRCASSPTQDADGEAQDTNGGPGGLVNSEGVPGDHRPVLADGGSQKGRPESSSPHGAQDSKGAARTAPLAAGYRGRGWPL